MPESGWKMFSHGHSHHELIVVVGGRMRVDAVDQHLDAGVGDVLLYPARVAHAEAADPADPVESFFVGFRQSHKEINEKRIYRIHDYSGRIRQLIRWLYSDQSSADPHARSSSVFLFRALLEELFRGDRDPEAPLVLEAKKYIRRNLADDITLIDLADCVGLSKYHFIRAYRRLTGVTPMSDVRRLRVESARNLLITTMLPLKDVAARCGLGNEYAFSRIFRQQMGVPPGIFRKSYGAAAQVVS